MTTEIFVLNYNGRDLLLECLPSIVAAAEKSPVPCPVTVIDNASADDSLDVLQKNFPTVRVIARKDNPVLCAFNNAARDSRADIVFLLNNDLKADPGFIAPLLETFEEKPDAFLAGPKTFTFDGVRYEGSLSKMEFKYGLLRAESRFPGYEAKINVPGFTMQSGFGAYRRKFFLELGGFDPLYLPGTVEDCDICFRAWKAGYACYYVPASRMQHKGQATFKRTFSRSRILAINQRNLYLFTWKNISSVSLLLSHVLFLLVRPLIFLLWGRPEFFWGLISALPRLSKALAARAVRPGSAVRSDSQIFAISESL